MRKSKSRVKLLIMNNDCLFSWGANSYGQLGLGHFEDTLSPARVVFDSSQAKLLKQITGGGGHTVLLTSEGNLFVCGWNKSGQLGLPPSEAAVSVPIPLPNIPWKVESVACGWNHTLAAIERGQVIAWGSNAYGQLGLPQVEKQTHIPTVIPNEMFDGHSVVAVGAGLRHSLALTDQGCVFTWGDGRKGQLGMGKDHLTLQTTPKQVVLQEQRVTSVSVGAYHSTAITADCSLLSWGLNRHGQCGAGPLTENLVRQHGRENFKVASSSEHVMNVYVPITVSKLPPITLCRCGWSHTLAIIVTREVYAWGRCDYGQLGYLTEDSERCQWTTTPTLVPLLSGTLQLEIGSEHNLAIISGDKLTVFGWNEHGMCGTGDEENVRQVTRIPFTYKGGLETAESGSGGGGGGGGGGSGCGGGGGDDGSGCVLIGSGAGHSMAVMKLSVETTCP